MFQTHFLFYRLGWKSPNIITNLSSVVWPVNRFGQLLVTITQSLARASGQLYSLDPLRCTDYVRSARWDLCCFWIYHWKPVGFILWPFQFKCIFQVPMCRWVNHKEVAVVLFPCTLSVLFYESFSLIIYCLLGGIGGFISFWHALARWPSAQHALLSCLCLTEKTACGGALSLRMVASHGDFGIRELAC